MMTETLKTRLHTYSFSIADAGGKAAYKQMLERIKADGLRHWMNSWSGNDRRSYPPSSIKTEDVELETKFIFSSQWNTADGRRVFDWFEEYPISTAKECKRGHWLEITNEMREARRNQMVCGYCGARYHAPAGNVFCTACLDSPYLKESELHLLRLVSCEEHLPDRLPLTQAELDHLLPQYVERQTAGADSRAVKQRKAQRERIEARYHTVTHAAKEEHDGLIWLLDHGVDVENVIYYSHTRIFSFGWRRPVSQAVKSQLLEVLTEFDHPYEIKAEDETISTVDR